MYLNIKDCDMWVDALNAKYFGKGKAFGRAEFDKLLGHCAAMTDRPTNYFRRRCSRECEALPSGLLLSQFYCGKNFSR